MKVCSDLRWILINKTGTSLYDLIADGHYKSTNVGRATWMSLIDGSSLQRLCNREGFNVEPTPANNYDDRVRIGILGDNHEDCHDPDSMIGIGMKVHSSRGQIYSGNTASYLRGIGLYDGFNNTVAWGYVFVQ